MEIGGLLSRSAVSQCYIAAIAGEDCHWGWDYEQGGYIPVCARGVCENVGGVRRSSFAEEWDGGVVYRGAEVGSGCGGYRCDGSFADVIGCISYFGVLGFWGFGGKR